MKLEYTAVAIDDDLDAARNLQVAVQLFLEAEGFDLDWQTCSTADELRAYLAGPRRPDIVVVDHRLGIRFDDENGPRWAAILRNRHFPFTDILFYGGDSSRDLRSRMADEGVDGVFCANRTEVRDALIGIVGVHLHRWTEAGSMRGLAVSLGAELDDLLRGTCVDVAQHHGDPVKTKIYEQATRKAAERSKDRPKTVEKHIKANAVDKLLHEHTEFSSADLAQVVAWFSECVPEVDTAAAQAFARRYTEDVIWKRNILAHGVFNPETQAFVDAKGRTFETTAQNCKAFRVVLRSYRRELQEMREAARKGALVFRKG